MIDAAEAADLLQLLADLPDPRRSPGRVHPVGYVLAVVLVAFTCPAFAHLTGAAAWAAAAPPWVLRLLGARPDPFTGQVAAPSEATIRRIVTGIDPDALQAAFATWLTGRLAARRQNATEAVLTAFGVDGKTLRGTRDASGRSDRMRHLLGAATHGQVMLAQVEVPGKTSEIDYVTEVLTQMQDQGLLGAGTVLTLDALHTLRQTATAIRATGAHYLMTVKGNTPNLANAIIDRLRTTAEDDLGHHTHAGKGHGRTEERLLLAAALDQAGQVHDDVTFPDAAQVARIVRHRGDAGGQRTSKEIVHVITSLPTDLAGPAALAGLVRGHWSIEALHHVRDQTFREDNSRVRTGHAPTVLAAVRNTITAAIRLAGHTNIAAARRQATLDIRTAIAWFTRRTEPDTSSL
jgi:predicted transposase YbfD/YdcC